MCDRKRWSGERAGVPFYTPSFPCSSRRGQCPEKAAFYAHAPSCGAGGIKDRMTLTLAQPGAMNRCGGHYLSHKKSECAIKNKVIAIPPKAFSARFFSLTVIIVSRCSKEFQKIVAGPVIRNRRCTCGRTPVILDQIFHGTKTEEHVESHHRDLSSAFRFVCPQVSFRFAEKKYPCPSIHCIYRSIPGHSRLHHPVRLFTAFLEHCSFSPWQSGHGFPVFQHHPDQGSFLIGFFHVSSAGAPVYDMQR